MPTYSSVLFITVLNLNCFLHCEVLYNLPILPLCPRLLLILTVLICIIALVRSDRLPGFQRQTNRPSLAAPITTASSLPATVPDQAEVLDLSQGPRREEAPLPAVRTSAAPPYLGQGMPAPSHARPGLVRPSSALSLVGALRRLGTRVNLVPVSIDGGVGGGNSNLATAAAAGVDVLSRRRSGGGGSSSSSSRRSSAHRHAISRQSDSTQTGHSSRRSRRPPRDPDQPSIVPAPSLPLETLQSSSSSSGFASLPALPRLPGESIALPLADATRLLAMSLETGRSTVAAAGNDAERRGEGSSATAAAVNSTEDGQGSLQ